MMERSQALRLRESRRELLGWKADSGTSDTCKNRSCPCSLASHLVEYLIAPRQDSIRPRCLPTQTLAFVTFNNATRCVASLAS